MSGESEIYLARNRTKRRCNDFMQCASGSASEFAFACSVMAIEEHNKKPLQFVTDSDRLIINKIRVWITSNR